MEEERYYFDFDDFSNCYEQCPVLNSGVMVGSVSCVLNCKNLIKSNFDINKGATWIVCEKLNEIKKQK